MVRIVTDTTSGLPRDQAAALGIAMVPQIVVFGESSYRDDNEIDTERFLSLLRSSPALPKTAAPPPALFTPIFEECAKRGETVICLHPSALLSGTVRSAVVASQGFSGSDIRVVDTRTISAPLAAIVVEAASMANAGGTPEEILARVTELMGCQHLFFVVDTLEFLQRGGRIGGAQRLLGELLQIKPILTLQEGRVEPLERQRTRKKALARVIELVTQGCPAREESHLSVIHADARQEALGLAAELSRLVGLPRIPIYELPPAIVVHGGPGLLGASYFGLRQ